MKHVNINLNDLDLEEKKPEQQTKRTRSPLSLFLLSLVLATVVFYAAPGFVGYDNVPIPELGYDYHFDDAALLRVKLYHNGDLYLNDQPIGDVGDLSRMIKRNILEKKKHGKVALLADRRVEYGKVADVLGQVKRAQVDSIFLEYSGRASVHDILSGK